MAPKKSANEELIMTKLVAIHEAANEDDRSEVAHLIKRATGSKRDSGIVTMTPGMAALIFFDHNKQNREWSVNSTLDYLRQIEAGEWEFTCQGIGFLTSGDLGDGQHRVAAIALSGKSIETLVAFGMTPQSVIALDTGRRRQAADFMHIQHPHADTGVLRRKQQMVKRAFGKLAQNPDEQARRPYVLKGNRDTAKAIEAHDALLNQAITIAEDSVRGRSKPTFPLAEAAAFVFMLLVTGWDFEVLVRDLDIFQSGEDRIGAELPLYLASVQLQKDATKRERASITARFGAALKAFRLHEEGVKAARANDIRAAMKPKQWIDPTYPRVVEPKAAE